MIYCKSLLTFDENFEYDRMTDAKAIKLYFQIVIFTSNLTLHLDSKEIDVLALRLITTRTVIVEVSVV